MELIFFKFIFFFQIFQYSNTLFGLEKCFVTDNNCPNVNITFWLYTRETEKNPLKLDVLNLDKKDFSSRDGLVLLIHGYTGRRDFSPSTEIRPVLLEFTNVSVISVDYENLVKEPCYIMAVANVKPVSRCIAQLLDEIVNREIFLLDEIHVIGFSLGGQVAGVVANYLKSGKLKRITGLDPAKPLFAFADDDDKLDRGDAEYVDVIHTDIFERGILGSSGHIDFYPNGGYNQPGCSKPTQLRNSSCNHYRAPAYYAESIMSDITFWGYKCFNWISYALGICRGTTNDIKTALMGYYVSTNLEGSYYLETNSASPFARGKNIEKFHRN